MLIWFCSCASLQGGGVFCNPKSSTAPAKLRLLYECAPLAYVVEVGGLLPWFHGVLNTMLEQIVSLVLHHDSGASPLLVEVI
jgi:fructose-1,6-bisphosphatase